MDAPDAYLLVRAGAAEPADEECERAANMTPLQFEQAKRAQKRASLGIHPDDFDAFDAGEMEGYYPDGSFRPGPNATFSEGGLIFDEYD